jgi:antitoxin MazE
VKAGGDLSLTVEKGPVVPMAAKAHPRSGWAEGAKAIADCGDAGLVWPEFGNAGDDEIVW